DKIIGRLTMDLQERGINFSVIYTAVRPSRVSNLQCLELRFATQIKGKNFVQATSTAGSVGNYSSGLGQCKWHPFFSVPYLIRSCDCSLHTQDQKMSLINLEEQDSDSNIPWFRLVNRISSLEIRFLMTNKFYEGSARNWSTLDSVEIVQGGEEFAKFYVSVISAPAEYSSHCQLVGTSNLYPARLIPSNEAKNWDVFISRLQIQGFNIENNQFSYASDCTGFFTPGIWMGLVTSIVLLWILAYGIHMIMQLTTNSRFDDLRGPSLSVPQTE
ncbi:VAS1 ATPase, partial [Probosciger aterrimus]|nr:VAS1 ATPase [Probosciger aterrimus]